LILQSYLANLSNIDRELLNVRLVPISELADLI
jgi:hypothetical protein